MKRVNVERLINKFFEGIILVLILIVFFIGFVEFGKLFNEYINIYTIILLFIFIFIISVTYESNPTSFMHSLLGKPYSDKSCNINNNLENSKHLNKLTLEQVREICIKERRCSNSFLQRRFPRLDWVTANEYWTILCRDKELMKIVDDAWEERNAKNT